MEEKTIAGAEGAIAVYVGGSHDPSSPVLLFVHSDGGQTSQWFKVWSRLDERYRLIGLDLRGHGQSEPARNEDYSYNGRADDIAAVAQATGLSRFIIVAHSAGAGSSLSYAARYPEQVAGLFFVDPASDPTDISVDQKKQLVDGLSGPNGDKVLHDYQASIAGDDPAVQSEVARSNALLGRAARAGTGKALAAWNPREALDEVTAPIETLNSNKTDVPGSLYHLKQGIRHHTLDGVGHWIALEKPVAVADFIDAFARRVGSA